MGEHKGRLLPYLWRGHLPHIEMTTDVHRSDPEVKEGLEVSQALDKVGGQRIFNVELVDIYHCCLSDINYIGNARGVPKQRMPQQRGTTP